MAQEDSTEAEMASEGSEDTVRSSPARRALKIGGGIILGLILLVLLAVAALNTGPGKRFVANQIANLAFANGLKIEAGRIDGSLYGRMILRNLKISDPKGVFLTSPAVVVDWRPFKYLRNHVDVHELSSKRIRLIRLPQFKPSEATEQGPLLPDIDIDVRKLEIGQFVIEPPVTGQRHIATFSGNAKIADRHVQLSIKARALRGRGIAGGDRIELALNAAPQTNRLDIQLTLDAPANGLVSGLTGTTKGLHMQIGGKGDWKRWDGSALASLGGSRIVNLSLTGRDGAFRTKGALHPDGLLAGPAQRLMGPVTQVDIRAVLAERRADITGRLNSDAFTLTADGLLNLADNRFGNMKLDFLLRKPTTVAENLYGRSVRAVLAVDGPFAKPVVGYRLTAGAIGFDEITVEGLQASGQARVDADAIMIPVNAQARRITGLDVAAGGRLENIRLNGDLAIKGPRILSDNMKIRSDRIDATAILIADMSKGLYTGALEGRVNNYRIESVGIFNLETTADLDTAPNGGFTLKGRVRARSTRLLNDSVRDFLGGNVLVAADASYDTDGIIRIQRLNVSAPAFRLTGGSGRYSPDGGISFAANAYSQAYGPLGVKVSGSLGSPVAYLTAPRPGVGIGLVNLKAQLRGSPKGYAVQASGGTDYGPFDADVLILTGGGPLTIEIKHGEFAGIDLRGRVRQTAAGPFDGQLFANGSGIDGTVQLSATGSYQRADIHARANNAVLPAPAKLVIGRAIIDGHAILYDEPEVVADVQFGQTQFGTLELNAARAQIHYQGGRGNAKLLAEGYSGVPFRIAANGALTPDLWRIALNGRVNGVDVKTQSPARIIPGADGYRLQPTVITFGKGAATVAGAFGKAVEIQSRFKDVDLAIVNSFAPGLNIGGRATGSLDFSQPAGSSFPQADARLNIAGFTRTSLSAVSQPVDISVAGHLLSSGGDLGAVLRRNDVVIGRGKASLSPLPPGSGSWMERLMGAPLSGGIRYNGPAGTLFSFAGLSDQTLSGAIGVAADFSGRLQSPQFTGLVRANKLTYRNETYGTRLSNMQIDGRFTNDRLQLNRLTARAGDGTVNANGFVSLSSAQGFPMDIAIKLDKAQLANSDNIGATATGDLRITNSANADPLIKGTIRLPETRYKVIFQGAANVPQLTGVRRKAPPGRKIVTGDPEPGRGMPVAWNLDIAIRADDQIYISGMGLESEWSSNLRITGTTADFRIAGDVDLVRGTYGFAGRSFELTEGRIRFTGEREINPTLDLSGSSDIEGVTTILNVTGRAFDPQISFTSNPALPQDEVVARILFGSSVANLSAIQAVQLASSLNALRGGGGGLNPLGKLRSATGIDRLRILGSDKATGRGTALAAGQHISDDIYVEIITDARGFTATQLEISLSKSLSVLSQAGSFGSSALNVRYKKDY